MSSSPSDPGSPEPPPPGSWKPLVRLRDAARRPLERFFRIEAASGILLLIAAAVALAWANSPWAESYGQLWHMEVGVRLGDLSFVRSLDWVVNDGLMVIFFFVVGLEIRREMHAGELSSLRSAALPAAAALGGMVVPAGLYLLVAGGPETRSGWGVPMATDIAFAVGILTLLGPRVPSSLRVTLLALAVIDDLGAIVVIALFYSSGMAVGGLALAAAALGVILLLQRSGVRDPAVYVLPAVVAWGGVYAAGVHPTIAGVIVGLMTPVRAWSEEEVSPADGLIHRLHPWVAYVIMPVFALANAGVTIDLDALGGGSWAVLGGALLGLAAGKPIGVIAASLLVLRLRVAALPAGMTTRHIVVLGAVAGVGFTMSLFIAQLAFRDAALLAAAKLGVLAASAIAAVLALALGRFTSPAAP